MKLKMHCVQLPAPEPLREVLAGVSFTFCLTEDGRLAGGPISVQIAPRVASQFWMTVSGARAALYPARCAVVGIEIERAPDLPGGGE